MKLFKNLFRSEHKQGLETYKKGMHYFNTLQYGKAITYFEKVLSQKTMANSLESNLACFYCGRAYINEGITCFTRNQNEKALAFFKKALAFNPEDTDLNYFIGICMNNTGDYEGAMGAFSKILEAEPWNIPTKLKMAIIFHNMNMWKDAEEIHRSILKKNPDFADVHFHLGLCLMGQGEAAQARSAFEKALDINPNYTDARIKLGLAHIFMGESRSALEYLEPIILKYPDYADVHYFIALAWEQNGDLDAALASLEKALAVSPSYKNALAKRILILSRMNRHGDALGQLEDAFLKYPDDSRLTAIQNSIKHHQEAEEKTGGDEAQSLNIDEELLVKELRNEFHKDLDIMPNFSEIIAMFNNPRYSKKDSGITEFLIPFILEQIKTNPTYPDLYNSLGTQLMLSEKHLEAEDAFKKALALNPEYVTARINLMKTFHRSKKYEDAKNEGEILTAKNLPFPDVYQTLAEVLYELGAHDEALLNATRVMKLRPAMTEVRLLMAKIYDKQGKKDAAVHAVQEFLKKDQTSDKNEAYRLLEKLNASGTTFL